MLCGWYAYSQAWLRPKTKSRPKGGFLHCNAVILAERTSLETIFSIIR
jgi:hypothetical protein